MSTKIYNGIIFTKKMSLVSLKKEIDNLRPKVTELVRKMYNSFAGAYIARIIDMKTFKLFTKDQIEEFKNRNLCPITHSFFRLCERTDEIKKTSTRDPEVDFDLSMVVFPVTGSKLLGMYFCEKKELEDILFRELPIKEYHYQDSTDRPEDISDKEWSRRERDWDKALGGNGYAIPAEAGFTIQISPVNSIISSADEILDNIPSKKKRLEVISRTKIIRDYEKKFNEFKVSEFKRFEEKRRSQVSFKKYMKRVSRDMKKITKYHLFKKI